MISDVKDDGSGTTEYDEFMKVIAQILNRNPQDQIPKASRLLNDDETGKISSKDLKRVATTPRS